MRNVTEIQRRLITLGYLAPGEDDGRFGEKSLDAYNHYRATKGKGAVVMASMAELNADLFPEEQPAPPAPRSNPITDYLTGLAIKAALNRLKGLIPMQFLLGTGTAVTGTVMIVVGAASLIGGFIPLGPIAGFVPLDPSAAMLSIGNGFGLIFLRRAVAKNGTGN